MIDAADNSRLYPGPKLEGVWRLRFLVLAVFIATGICSASSTKIKCVADLPANNSYGLPVSWWIELDTDEDEAHVTYAGGPKDGVAAGQVVGHVLATEEYAGGWDISDFNYKVQDRELRVLLAFKEEGYKSGEMRFRAKMNRFKKGTKLLDVATAYCNPL
jgi:hypothetical protein